MSDQGLVASLQARFPGALVGQQGEEDELTLSLSAARLIQVSEFLRDEPEAQFNLLLTLTAVQDRVHYQLVSLPKRRRLRLSVPRQPPPDSLSLIWPAANWAEREANDRWEIQFVGHPGLAPLLRPSQEIGPIGQGKDFWQRMGRDRQMGKTFLPGSSYPASLEGWFIAVDTDGERVEAIRPVLGWRHTAIEDRIIAWPCQQGTLLAARMDGFSAMQADLAYALAVESLLRIEPPPRAQQLRIIYAELQRIASHLSWLARTMQSTSTSDLAAPWYMRQGGKWIGNLFQYIGGNPITPDAIVVGGLRRDAPDGFESTLQRTVAKLGALFADIDTLVSQSAAFRSHQEGIGMIDPGTALGLGVTGPCLRASGVNYDVRCAFPYSGYHAVEVKTAIAREGDAWARCRVRISDMRASLDIIRQAEESLVEGQIDCFAPQPPPKRLPPGKAYASVEGARGELGVVLVSDGTERLSCAHIRAPSLANLSALPLVAHQARIEHVETILNSLDVSIAEAAR